MTTPTPTDADRDAVREWWLMDAESEAECLENFAVFRAQARREGEEAMREKAIVAIEQAQVRLRNSTASEEATSGIDWLSAVAREAIRARPTRPGGT